MILEKYFTTQISKQCGAGACCGGNFEDHCQY